MTGTAAVIAWLADFRFDLHALLQPARQVLIERRVGLLEEQLHVERLDAPCRGGRRRQLSISRSAWPACPAPLAPFRNCEISAVTSLSVGAPRRLSHTYGARRAR